MKIAAAFILATVLCATVLALAGCSKDAKAVIGVAVHCGVFQKCH